jgi:predicted  nucleic acid-binding Zn-ribbon protein
MNARDYLETIYIWNNDAVGPDIAGTTGINLQGYYPRIKALNEKLEERNEVLTNTAKDLVQYKAELETATAGMDAASSGLEQVREDFLALTKREFPTSTNKLDDDTSGRTDVKKLLQEYATYYSELTNHTSKKTKAEVNLEKVQQAYDKIETEIKDLKNSKIALNQLFFQKYSRFIQEGTWIDEEYVDDDLYYNDALSVLYNSCYPQVAY